MTMKEKRIVIRACAAILVAALGALMLDSFLVHEDCKAGYGLTSVCAQLDMVFGKGGRGK